MRSFDTRQAPRLGSCAVARLIGEGAHSRVYLAWDTRSQEWVALKTLSLAAAQEPAIRRRFEAEAHALEGLSHPYLLRIVSVEEHNGLPFVVTDLARCGSVYDWIDRNGPLGARRAVALARKCGEAVAHLHQNGRVHGDLGPHRLLINQSGIAVVADPGVALDAMPAFASPERLAGEPLDARADGFSLGASLITMLTASLDEDLASIELRDPRLARVPEPLRAVVVRACRHEPDERFPSMPELVRALELAANPLPLDAEGPSLTDRVVPLPSDPETLAPDADLGDLLEVMASFWTAPLPASGRTPDRAPTPVPRTPTPMSRTPASRSPDPRTPPPVSRSRSPAPMPRSQTPPSSSRSSSPGSAGRHPSPPPSPPLPLPVRRRKGRSQFGRIVALFAVLALLVGLAGVAGLGFAIHAEVRADQEAATLADDTERALVLAVLDAGSLVTELAVVGGSEERLNAAWKAFTDASGPARTVAAAGFAAAAAEEAAPLEMSSSLRTQVAHVDRLRKEWEGALDQRVELRRSWLGAVVGYFRSVTLYTPREG